MSAYILILDDDADVATAAQLLLRRRHGQVATLSDPAGLPALLARGVPDVVLLDMNFTPGRINGAEGLALLDLLRAQARPPAVIAMTAYADVPLAVEALKRGAGDFITKPWDNARLIAAIDQALARREAVRGGATGSPELMGESRAMRELKGLIASVAPTEANVMVLGENGVGKELVARAIHAASRRAAGTMLAVDMGALPESTFESELFGHRKGSFTDAKSDRAGRFQAARGERVFTLDADLQDDPAEIPRFLERLDAGLDDMDAIFARDREVVMAGALIAGLLSLLCILIADLLYAIADPRVSYE